MIMLTNDDGINADGLAALREAFTAATKTAGGPLSGQKIVVVAPDSERSACGHALTWLVPLHVDDVSFPHSEVPGVAVTGTPVDCVKLAVRMLYPQQIDLVVAGVNRGPNLGTDIFYSGTVSGAIEAAILGVPAIAVSLGAFESPDYTAAARFAAYLAGEVLVRGLPAGTLLNVNVPAMPAEEMAGVAVTRLGVHRWEDTYVKRQDPRGRTYYWLTGHALDEREAPGTDVQALRDNLISVTPIHLDLTAHDFLPQLQSWGLSDWGGVRAKA